MCIHTDLDPNPQTLLFLQPNSWRFLDSLAGKLANRLGGMGMQAVLWCKAMILHIIIIHIIKSIIITSIINIIIKITIPIILTLSVFLEILSLLLFLQLCYCYCHFFLPGDGLSVCGFNYRPQKPHVGSSRAQDITIAFSLHIKWEYQRPIPSQRNILTLIPRPFQP